MDDKYIDHTFTAGEIVAWGACVVGVVGGLTVAVGFFARLGWKLASGLFG